MNRNCENCWLCSCCPTDPVGPCRLNGRMVLDHDNDCLMAITDADVEAAKMEYLEEKHGVPTRGKSWLEPVKYQHEMERLKCDILRVKLEREKLRLEREKLRLESDNSESVMRDWVGETLCYSTGARMLIGTGRTYGLYRNYVDFCAKHNASPFSLSVFKKTVAGECNRLFDVDNVCLARMCKGYVLENIYFVDPGKRWRAWVKPVATEDLMDKSVPGEIKPLPKMPDVDRYIDSIKVINNYE